MDETRQERSDLQGNDLLEQDSPLIALLRLNPFRNFLLRILIIFRIVLRLVNVQIVLLAQKDLLIHDKKYWSGCHRVRWCMDL